MDPALRLQAKEFLLGIPVFGGLPDATMDRLLDMMQMRGHRAGENVCCEGDLGREMFVVRAGLVDVRKRARDQDRQTLLAELKTGDCFGEMSLIDVQPRSATVRALAATRLLRISSEHLDALYRHDVKSYAIVVLNIARDLSRRLRVTDGILADIAANVLDEYVR